MLLADARGLSVEAGAAMSRQESGVGLSQHQWPCNSYTKEQCKIRRIVYSVRDRQKLLPALSGAWTDEPPQFSLESTNLALAVMYPGIYRTVTIILSALIKR